MPRKVEILQDTVEMFEGRHGEILQSWNLRPRPDEPPPTIEMEPETWCDVLNAVRAIPTELMWFHKVTVLPHRIIRLARIAIPYQECSAGHTETIDREYDAILKELERAGESHSEYRAWGHSHVASQAYMSRTDRRAIRKRLAVILENNPSPIVGPWVSLVVNRYAEVRCWVNFARPGNGRLRWRDLPLGLSRAIPEAELAEMLLARRSAVCERIRERVEQRIFVPGDENGEEGSYD